MALALQLFFHSMALASIRFYTLTFSIVLMCLKLNNGKLITSSTQTYKNIQNFFE